MFINVTVVAIKRRGPRPFDMAPFLHHSCASHPLIRHYFVIVKLLFLPKNLPINAFHSFKINVMPQQHSASIMSPLPQ